MRCFVTVGAKYGDLLSVIPIIHHWFRTNQQKPFVMVSRKYADLFDRVDNMTPVIYPGEWSDLSGALRLAKEKYDDVVCLSTYGIDFPIEHRTSSFQLEAYERAGVLDCWDALKLEISAELHRAFVRPTILLADHSQSSPFLQKQELYALLKEKFPSHDIVRLSEMRLDHLAEFLPWYDAAKALVVVECVHLHLSAATDTPVFALATDRPSKWHGSCWSKRFAFYCRYGDFDERKGELIEAIGDTLAGAKKPEVVCLN